MGKAVKRRASVGACALRIAASLAAAAMGCAAEAADAVAPIHVYAAPVTEEALTEITSAYSAASHIPVKLVFASSGLIPEKVKADPGADVIVSANFEVPEAFAAAGRAGSVVLYARNRMCGLAPATASVTPANLLETMLKPETRIGTSTPKSDPGGDYVWAAFEKADQLRPGARAILEGKAQPLIGGLHPAPVPAGRNPIAYWVQSGRVDLFLYYCTAAMSAAKQAADVKVVPFPGNLAIVPEYGLTVLQSDPMREARASRYALYLPSSAAQAVFRDHGFIAAGVSRGMD